MGTELEGKNVCFNLDNQAVVDVLKTKYSRDSRLICCVAYACFAARHTFWFWAKHVPGR